MTDPISQFEHSLKTILSMYNVNLSIEKGSDKKYHLVGKTCFYDGLLYFDNFLGDVKDNNEYVNTHCIFKPNKKDSDISDNTTNVDDKANKKTKKDA